MDAPRRSDRCRLDGRPDGPQKTTDDIDRVVLDLQFHRRLRADFLVLAAVPHAAGHRHGRRMASRRRARDGAMAATLARLYEWCIAGLVGPRLLVIERLLLAAIRQLGL